MPVRFSRHTMLCILRADGRHAEYRRVGEGNRVEGRGRIVHNKRMKNW